MQEPRLPRDELLVGIVNAGSDFHVASRTKPYQAFSSTYKVSHFLRATCVRHAGCRSVHEFELAMEPDRVRRRRMKWGRGFFRTWLVVSAIWIGLFIYFSEPKTYSWLWRAPKHVIEFSSGHQTTFDTSKSHQELVADITEEWKREAERLKIRDGQQAADEILQSISAKRDDLLETFSSNNKKIRREAERLWLVTPPAARFRACPWPHCRRGRARHAAQRAPGPPGGRCGLPPRL
jgi:hypothetical protein